MLDIIIIIICCRKIGAIVRKKGHRAIGYQLMFAAMWLGGEVGGVVMGTVLIMILNQGEPSLGLIVLPALVGAIFGGWLAFFIANRIAPVEPEYPEEEYDDREYRPSPRKESPQDWHIQDKEQAPQNADWRIEEKQ